MSNLEELAVEDVGGARRDVIDQPVFDRLDARRVVLTPRQWSDASGRPAPDPLEVYRFVPTKGRRMVGAWCFVDFYGPDDISGADGMRVAPHPHCGLQTVTWLLAGEVLHRDSLGSVKTIEPGQLNLMTAGEGIAHAETSVQPHSPTLHGAQLWIALPDEHRRVPAGFAHHASLPEWRADGVTATVLIGELAGVRSPATAYSPLVGAELRVAPGAAAQLELRPDWEYAVLTMSGSVGVAGELLGHAEMAYLGCGRTAISVAAVEESRSDSLVLLIGGEPFTEELVMWWNFVARSHDEIVQAREQWMAGERFGAVSSYPGDPLPAPPLPPLTLKPRGRT